MSTPQLFGNVKKIYFLSIFVLCVSCSDDPAENDAAIAGMRITSVSIGSEELRQGQVTEDVSIDAKMSVSFSKGVLIDDFENSVTITESTEKIDINITQISDFTFELSPSTIFRNNSTYTITVDDALVSEDGSTFEGALYRFKTEEKVIELLSATYGNNEGLGKDRTTNVPLNLDLDLMFSGQIDVQSLSTALSIGSGIELNFTTEDNNVVNVSTKTELPPLSRYVLSISDNVRGANGESFRGFAQECYTQIDSTYKFPEITDEELLTKVQEQTFKYFWDFGHPNSGLARERNTSGDLVTIGGSGFGVMSILVGIERGFITRQEGVERLEKIVDFLENADRFHGVWPHWMNGNTGATIPFSATDDGADLVETAFMIQGLLAVRQYLNNSAAEEAAIISKITELWEEVEWTWFQQESENVLTWHWSPNFGFALNLKIRGWNEALIIYTLAAASPTYPITKEVYEEGWARNGDMINGNSFYNIQLPLGEDRGGPLFFAHYSFLGMDPRNLEDQYANYMEQNIAHSLINRAYCIANPQNYVGYGENAWGLTASDNQDGYSAHSPNNDLGVITPTAAISSIPYTPEESMAAIKHFYYLMGDRLWGEYGFHDAYNVTENWYADSYLAIDQGPIIIMIENYRTGLIWDLFMSDPEVQASLTTLGFAF